jgi:hypothetical protein
MYADNFTWIPSTVSLHLPEKGRILEGQGRGIEYSAFSLRRKYDCGENLDLYTLGKVQREMVGQVANEISSFLIQDT